MRGDGIQSIHNRSFSSCCSPTPPWTTALQWISPCSGVKFSKVCSVGICSTSCWRISALVLRAPPFPLFLPSPWSLQKFLMHFSFLIFPSHHSLVVLPFLNHIFPEELPAWLRGSAMSSQWWVHWNQHLTEKVVPVEPLKEAATAFSPVPAPWQGHT